MDRLGAMRHSIRAEWLKILAVASLEMGFPGNHTAKWYVPPPPPPRAAGAMAELSRALQEPFQHPNLPCKVCGGQPDMAETTARCRWVNVMKQLPFKLLAYVGFPAPALTTSSALSEQQCGLELGGPASRQVPAVVTQHLKHPGAP